jgi:putative DNA primase/helicase
MTTTREDSPVVCPDSLEGATSLLEAALWYISVGWRVFPVGQDKKPLTPHGFKDASADERLIREWWGNHPKANIALDIPEGFVILDFDPRNGAPEPGDVLPEDSLYTIRVYTAGGGTHLYFRVPAESQLVAKWMTGIDVKRAGLGYVLLPPSENAAGGQYAWDQLFDLEWVKPLPPWLLRVLTKPEPVAIDTSGVKPAKPLFPWEAGTAYGIRALEQLAGHVLLAPEGERNVRLNRSGFRVGQLVAAGELKSDEALHAVAMAAEFAGLEKHEVYQTLKSSFEAGLEKPWEKRNAHQAAD